MTTKAPRISASKTKTTPAVKKSPAIKTTATQQSAEKPIAPKAEKTVAVKKPATTKSQPATAKTLPKQTKQAAAKPKKSKLIRDSFTIPDHEYKLIQTLKERSINHGVALKKSELIRAGILKLSGLSDNEFKKAIAAVDIIKTGRPTKAK